MNTINTNVARIGNFTSSEIVALTTKGKDKGSYGAPFYTYIEECNMERRLQRSITDESSARPLSWGKLGETIAFEKLGLNYSLNSQETTVHPDYDFWSGSADGFKDNKETVGEIKSPMTLKSFCRLVDPLYNGLSGIDAMNAIRFGWEKDGSKIEKHKDGEKFYYQIVSNAIIHKCKFGELIVFMPYQSELQEFRELAQQAPQDQIYKYFWIANGNDEELPYLIDGGYYKNINIIRFEIPQSDKDFLTERVLRGSELLQPFYERQRP